MSDVALNFNYGGKPVARIKNGILEVRTDDIGLFITADLSGTVEGRNLYEGERLLCRSCGELVHPKTISEFIGEPGHGGYEEWEVCPICGEDDLTKWKECPRCMRIMPTGEDYCDTCIGEVKFAIKVAVRAYDSELIRIAMEEMLEE